MTKTVEFARRGDANEIRNRLEDFTADDDDRRSKTLKLDESVPDSMVQRVREEAADSRQAEADKAGQTATGELGTDSMSPNLYVDEDVFADGVGADTAFVAAEEERASDDPLDGLDFTDDRDEQGSMLDFGMETDATQHRESREAEAQASEFGVDDRSDDVFGESMDGGDQSGLEGFGGGTRENKSFDDY